MSYFKETLEYFNKVHSGNIQHFPLVRSPNSDELSKLGKCIFLGKSVYTLLAGNSGSGKTAIADSEFILKVYFWWKRNRDNIKLKPYWVYRSMERPTKFKIAKWICYLLYVEHNILIDVPTFFQFPNKIRELSSNERKLIKGYEKWFTHEFENYITIISGSENPTGIRNNLMNFYRKRGKEYRATDKYILLNGKKVKDFTGQNISEKDKRFYEIINGIKVHQYDFFYKPDDNNEIVCHITDHCQALKDEKGLGDKGKLDKHSEYCRIFRDIYGTFIINISQMNRGQDDSLRKYKGELDIFASDIKGSGNLFEDADVVLGMINPYKSGETGVYRHYKVSKLVLRGYNRLRIMKVLKNSYGLDDIRVGYAFQGETGLIMELPRGKDMTIKHYDLVKNNKFLEL